MNIYSSTDEFQISGRVNEDNTIMVMRVPGRDHVFTGTLPATSYVLQEHLPSIFKCQCFNDKNNSFRKESRDTELGHLFEHIFLEYLCMEKINNGGGEAVYEGVTNWNWEQDPVGTFYVNIKIGAAEIKIIKSAFEKAVDLLKRIVVG